MTLAAITPPEREPVSKRLGVTGSIPGILRVSDTTIKAGKITVTKLIRTIEIENKNTIHVTRSIDTGLVL